MGWEAITLTLLGALIGFLASELRIYLQNRKRKKYVDRKFNKLLGTYRVIQKNNHELEDTITISRGEKEALITKGVISHFTPMNKDLGSVTTEGLITFNEDNFVIGTGIYQITSYGHKNRSGKSDITIMADGTIHVLNHYLHVGREEVVFEQFIWEKVKKGA
jgi:hypothetical protein